MKFILTILGTIGALFGIIFLSMWLATSDDDKLWNDGVCAECEVGEYQLWSVTAGRNLNSLDYYFYKCDNCEHVIKVHFQYPRVTEGR